MQEFSLVTAGLSQSVNLARGTRVRGLDRCCLMLLVTAAD